jgi:hypothetical protein
MLDGPCQLVTAGAVVGGLVGLAAGAAIAVVAWRHHNLKARGSRPLASTSSSSAAHAHAQSVGDKVDVASVLWQLPRPASQQLQLQMPPTGTQGNPLAAQGLTSEEPSEY